MISKQVTNIPIKELIKKLVALQKIDFEIYSFNKELTEKPQIIEEMKISFENKKGHLINLESQLKELQVARKTQELELQQLDVNIAKANIQLFQIKTNKEYTAKMTEIENIKAEKSRLEEKTLLIYDQIDAFQAMIVKERGVLSEEENKFQTQKSEIEKILQEFKGRVSVLEAKRSELTPDIDPQKISMYERILGKKDGLAIVPILSNACGGCYMNVPPQVINEIKKYDHILICEMCARLIYLEEDL